MIDNGCPNCERVKKLETALSDLFAMMDEGLLVRNIDSDHEAGWAMKQITFVTRLKAAHDLLKEGIK